MLGETHISAPADTGAAHDVLIIGAGLAGLFLALKLAPRRCTVLSPAPLGQAASSAWAQGGLAAALDPSDSAADHAADTIAAGDGLVDPTIAHLIATDGPARVADLLTLGVPFDRTEEGQLALSLEAAHRRPRVARVAGDLAGRAIMDALVTAVEASDHITVLTGQKAVALLQTEGGEVAGCVLADRSRQFVACRANHTVVCTGGLGGLYAVTTNPAGARGDALAMAARCGAALSDLEFVQFHPTAMDVGRDPAPLATEALRGDGAILRNHDGRAFMGDYHSDADLAPRDTVARAIHTERLAGRGALLDASQAIGNAFPDMFPTVYAACQTAGIDPRIAPIPVAPAAHYHMGGILTDIWGATSLDGLSACGECASTGAHGANRLASNSLLEAVVFADRIAQRLREDPLSSPGQSADAWVPPQLSAADLVALRNAMQSHCGVVRNASGLTTVLAHIETTAERQGWASELIVSRAMATLALARNESRGGHYRSDATAKHDLATRSFHTLDLRVPSIEEVE